MTTVSVNDQMKLRRPTIDDAEAIYRHISNWSVMKNLSSPPWPYGRQDAIEYVRAAETAWADGTSRGYAIDLHGEGYVGNVSFFDRSRGRTIGYWLAEPFWGRGIMTEAVCRALVREFDLSEHDSVFAEAFDHNPASLRVLRKVGFCVTGQSRGFSNPLGREMPQQELTMTREAFHEMARCSRH